jgi:dolichol-phosphate mannosyltransferase
MDISIVVPVYNEADAIYQLFCEIESCGLEPRNSYEIIFVNDGSTDNSSDVIKELSIKHNHVLSIVLEGNEGQSFAVSEGIKAAKGNILVLLDADLQNDPTDIPKMILKLDEGFDLICGWRKRRKDQRMFVVSSQMANKIIRFLFNISIHDTGCSLKAGHVRYFKEIKYFRNYHRYFPILMKKIYPGIRIAEVIVNHRKRETGEAKYSIFKSVGVFFELLYLSFI